MHEDSPPFIVIRTPAPPRPLYDRALELVARVHKLVDQAQARFHIKDRLDRTATALVFELSRAKHEVKPLRWRHYRRAHALVADCIAILDILHHQEAVPAHDLEPARDLAEDLLAALGTLG